MTMPRHLVRLCSVCVAAIGLLAACASGPADIPPDLSAAEIFQRAQDATDKGDYPLGIRYYSMIESSHPEDISHVTWASYEIAFLYHKMGKDELALTLITDLLDKYSKDNGSLPPAPHVLALKLKARLEEAAQKTQTPPPAQ
jgi:outer membrane protein assembly factor BamD (BamD/ComL family)